MAAEVGKVASIAAASIGKIMAVAEASIGKVTGVTFPAGAPPVGGMEWMAWDYDPFDPMFEDWLETQVYT